jgi:hypothetical protein
MIEQLAARVFAARNIVHREHWKTKSYSQHMALGDFYEQVIGVIDEIIEVYQGRYGLIPAFTVADQKVASIETYLLNEAIWIETNRSKFATCSGVLALIDDLIAVYLRTNYKLTHLS